jgi:hypothetical protein
MDPALILADQIIGLIRRSGCDKMEAFAALEIANDALPSIRDISFRNDLEEPAGKPLPSPPVYPDSRP